MITGTYCSWKDGKFQAEKGNFWKGYNDTPRLAGTVWHLASRKEEEKMNKQTNKEAISNWKHSYFTIPHGTDTRLR